MKLGIIGAVGVDDIGDVIMLEAALEQFKKIEYTNSIDIDLIIFALNKEKATKQIKKMDINAEIVSSLTLGDLSMVYNNFQFNNLLKVNLKHIIKNDLYYSKIEQCDALFFIGGGYFNSYWGNKLIPTFILPIALGYQLNKPIFISGINIGPFSKEQISSYIGLFSKVNTLILRDRKPSIDILEKLGGTEGNLILGADDILSIWYDDKKLKNNNLLVEDSNYAVLQLHHWVERYSENYIEFYKTLAEFLNYVIDKKYIDKVYFLPFTYFKGVDYECGRRLETFMNERKEYVVLNPTDNHIFMRELISGSEFVIASRYHPVVFGLGEQVPTLGIYVNDLYKQKISGAYDVLKVDKDNNMIYVNDISQESLIKWYKTNVKNESSKRYCKKRTENIDSYAIDRIKSIEKFIKTVKSY